MTNTVDQRITVDDIEWEAVLVGNSIAIRGTYEVKSLPSPNNLMKVQHTLSGVLGNRRVEEVVLSFKKDIVKMMNESLNANEEVSK